VLPSLFISTGSKSPGAIHRSLPAVLASVGMEFILAPIAYGQCGFSGLAVVLSFGIAMVASVWLAAWGATKLSHNHELVARLFASSGVRMVAPMIIAVVVVLAGGRIAPLESVYYVLPLYMCMLVVDVFGWVREAQSSVLVASIGRQHNPIAGGEVG
jgi:hypothetical protein